MSKDLLADYDQNRGLYIDFTNKLRSLVEDLVAGAGVKFHSVTCRTKERESLSAKVQAETKYKSLADVTDISGLRITTYLQDDVETISKLIENEFAVDRENSIDKGKALDPDRFGYVSVHYVVSFSDERCNLSEYRRFRGVKAELQIRSILQHAWAEIEHDLGYKSEQEVPREIRRRFSRIAGLFELVDTEFISIKQELARYSRNVRTTIESEPQSVEINKDSLAAFLDTPLVVDINDQLHRILPTVEFYSPDATIPYRLQVLNYFDIKTIGQLDAMLRANQAQIIQLARKHFVGNSPAQLSKDVPIFFLGYVLAAKGGEEKLLDYFTTVKIFASDSERRNLAKKIMSYF